MVFDHRLILRPNFVELIWPFSVRTLKILIKNTIVKVWGGGQQSMDKDHTCRLFNFKTHPYRGQIKSETQKKYYIMRQLQANILQRYYWAKL